MSPSKSKPKAKSKGNNPSAGRTSAKRKPTPKQAVRKSAARKRQERRALYIRLVAAAVVLLIGGAVVYSAASPSSETASVVEQLKASPAECSYDTKFDGDASDQGQHIPNPTYELDPPAGGAHNPRPANPGFYEGSDAPSDGELVHAMEHGFVVLWYRPDLDDADRATLAALSDRFGRELIVAPRPSLEGKVATTAWHRRLVCEEIDADAIALFTTTFKDQGPEKGFL